MYDKVKFWKDRYKLTEDYDTIASLLDSAKRQTDRDTGEELIFGSINGMRVSLLTGGMVVEGSLPKFLHDGSNVYPLNRRATNEAVEKLSDELHTDMADADIRSLEFGTNFLMKHRVQEYIARLGDMPLLQREEIGGSLYYQGKGRKKPKVFTFYDKMDDAEAKGMSYPTDLADKNILRYEMRLKYRLPKLLNTMEVKASTLSEKSFYMAMVRMYQNSYFSIRKHNTFNYATMSSNDEKITVKRALEEILGVCINALDPDLIKVLMNRYENAFAYKKDFTRLKAKIGEAVSMANELSSDELIKELDDEIKNCGAYI